MVNKITLESNSNGLIDYVGTIFKKNKITTFYKLKGFIVLCC